MQQEFFSLSACKAEEELGYQVGEFFLQCLLGGPNYPSNIWMVYSWGLNHHGLCAEDGCPAGKPSFLRLRK